MSDYKLVGKNFTPPDITGKVTGRAPLDRVKVALAIVAAALVTAIILWWQSRGG